MKIPELSTAISYKKFLKEKGFSIAIPDSPFEGGEVMLSKMDRTAWAGGHAKCQIQKHPNCCGAKLLHSASVYGIHGKESEPYYRYVIGGALLWCKINKNASANYVVASNQEEIEAALISFDFKRVQQVLNPKSGHNFSTYIINPLEL